MGIASGKGRVSGVGSFFKVQARRQVKFGELVTSQGLDNGEEFGHSYTNWSGAGVVPLMSPWQDKTNQHRAIGMHDVQTKPLDSCPQGSPQGSCYCIGTLGPWHKANYSYLRLSKKFNNLKFSIPNEALDHSNKVLTKLS